MGLRIAIVLATLALVGCGGADRPPTTPLADSTLVKALVESHVASARAGRTGENADSLRAAALSAIGVDTSDVSRALVVYADHPRAFLTLYDRVVDELLDEQMRHDILTPVLDPHPPDTDQESHEAMEKALRDDAL
jgi:hypothetical protein